MSLVSKALFKTLVRRLTVSASDRSTSVCSRHPLFEARGVVPGIYLITEKYFESWNQANMFYVVGSERDMLIDTGIGIFDLPAFLRYVGRFEPFLDNHSKPLSVVLTHCHFDHAGGASQFRLPNMTVFIHSAEKQVIAKGNDFMTAAWVTKDEIVPKPGSHWNPRQYRVHSVPTVRAVEDHSTLDLGNRCFEVLHLPGHSPGSIALLDEDNGVLASGDTLYETDSELIDWYPKSSTNAMVESVQRIHDLALRGKFETLLPGHNRVLFSREKIVTAANRFLGMSSLQRRVGKTWSRLRANTLLRIHAASGLGETLRDSLKH